jgi:hypothetical protein
MNYSAGAVQNGLVLRLSVPASGEMAGLGPELATRLAVQIGITPAHAAKAGDAIGELSRTLAPSAGADIEFEFHKLGAELKITARHEDRVAESHVPLQG